MSKKAKGFNTPFDKLADVKLPPKAPPAPPPPKTAPAKTAPAQLARANVAAANHAPAAAPSTVPVADDDVFANEMRGVVELPPDPRGRIIGGGAPPPSAPRRRLDDEAEAYAALADLVDGTGLFDVSATDEYIEGVGPGIDKRLLRKLRAGDYAVQAHLDLHGHTSDEARVEVEKFLTAARSDGRRCVLIIHGRGHGSKEGIPVLKERLKVWLTRGRIGRGVLAFCTARPTDGGAGAVYVLLRK